MEETRGLLRLVDDPVARILRMLKDMPLESAVACLERAAGRADRLGVLSPQDRARLRELLARIPDAGIDQAA